MSGAKTVGVIEAAYAVDRATPEWLDGVVKAVAPVLDAGHGVWAGLYDASRRDAFRIGSFAGVGVPAERLELLKAGAETLPYAVIERTFVTRTCGTLSQLLGASFLDTNPLVEAFQQTWGIADSIGINAQDPTMFGCVLGVPLSKRQPVSAAFGARWSRLAAHVASGFRLRRQLDATLQRGLDGAEAVLEPDGALAHAEGPATDGAARLALRGAAVALDKARARAVKTPDADAAIEAWRPLVEARWTLYDHFERDGRRYYVARRNDPALAEDALTPRERQVVGFAALGHSNKLIAYELGLGASTVATHLSSAAKKLGLTSRLALIKQLRASRALDVESS
ncbi:MAG: helix-turn-helix transcriptional regulator [Myxococcaceae bacterium]|nr:helix-turn-helix transcriptional regulator [Myxococcaceae bacterium]